MFVRRNDKVTADRRRRLIRWTAVPLAISVALLGLGLGTARTAAATGNSLRIDPAVQSVPQDGTFTAHIVQHADVPTSGAA
ncbi:MAG TPA: hypothetical protein VHS36_02870, partial [Candidatus Limnocylindrales bacterium]|nr:hypothetical protein [Candidatus Limnocylindrales bacterium]